MDPDALSDPASAGAAHALMRSMLSAGTSHAQYRPRLARSDPSVARAKEYLSPQPSSSLSDFRIATRIEAEGHNGRLCDSFMATKKANAGCSSSSCGADSGALEGTEKGKLVAEKKSGLAKTCPLQAIAHLVLRKLDAIALGRHVPRAAISSIVMPTKMEPMLLARLSGRIYNARFVGDHGLFVASAQNSVVRTYDFGNRDVPELTNSIRCQDAAWTVSDVDVGFEGGVTGCVPDFLVYSSLNNVVQMVRMREEDDHDSTHSQEPLDFSQTGDVRTVWAIQLSGDNSRLIAGTGMSSPSGLFRFAHNSIGGVTVFDMETRSVLYNYYAHENDTNSVTYFNRETDPNLLVSGADDGLAHLWDIRVMRRAAASGSENKPLCTFVGHSHGLTHVDSRNDGRFFITSSKDSTIKLWDIRRPSSADQTQWNIRRDLDFDYRFSNRPALLPVQPDDVTDSSVITYKGSHTVLKTLIRARFSPRATTGQRFIQTGSADGACVLYDALTGKAVERLAFHDSVLRDSSWHPCRPLITTSSWDRSIALWGPSAEDLSDPQDAEKSSVKEMRRSERQALNDDEVDKSEGSLSFDD